MKTEMQIIERFQAQAQAQAKAKEEQFKFEHLTAQQIDQWKKQQHHQQHLLHQQPPPQQMQHHPDVPQVNTTMCTLCKFRVNLTMFYLQIAPSPIVLANTPAELLQPTDMFRPKNDNIKEIEANRSKAAKAKAEPSAAKPANDVKPTQNINKINNNAVEMHFDESHIDKVDVKANKAKNAVAAKVINEPKANQKVNNVQSVTEAINKSNNNVVNAAAPKAAAKESTKKKSKEKDQKAAEEKRRQHEEEEERKRLELIAAQRRAKLVDQTAVRVDPVPKRNNLAASVGE